MDYNESQLSPSHHDNTIDESTHTKTSGKNGAIIAAILAFIPCTGVLGIHDLALGRYKKAITHMLLAYALLGWWLLLLFFGGRLSSMALFRFFLNNALQYAPAISYIWAIIEGILVLLNMGKINTTDSLEQDETYENYSHSKAMRSLKVIQIFDVSAYIILALSILLLFMIFLPAIHSDDIGAGDTVIFGYIIPIGIMISFISVLFVASLFFYLAAKPSRNETVAKTTLKRRFFASIGLFVLCALATIVPCIIIFKSLWF